MKEILLSIIIPCYQSSKTLPLCFQSLMAMDQDYRVEIILVDNNADPETRIVLEASGRTVVKETIQGPAAARNKGAQVASGKFLMFLDSDCVVPATFFEELFSLLDQWRADAYQVSIEPCDRNLKLHEPQASYEWSMKNMYTLGTFNACSVDQKIPLLDSACLILRKDVFHELQGFPPLQRFEDRALGLKLFEQGRLVIPLINLKVKKIISPRTFWKLLSNDWEDIRGQVWCEESKPNRIKFIRIGSSYRFPRWSALKDLHLYIHHFLRKLLIPLFVMLHRLVSINDNSYLDGDQRAILFQVGEEKFSFNTATHIVVINSLNKLTLINKKNNQCTEIVKDISREIIRSVLNGQTMTVEDKMKTFLFLGLKKRFIKRV